MLDYRLIEAKMNALPLDWPAYKKHWSPTLEEMLLIFIN
jgi:hypothetical protein